MNSKRNEPAGPTKGEKSVETSRKPGTSGLSPAQDIFDVRRIRRLVELMKEHDLGEIDLRQGETRIQLRRGSTAPPSVAAAPVAAASAPCGGLRQRRPMRLPRAAAPPTRRI